MIRLFKLLIEHQIIISHPNEKMRIGLVRELTEGAEPEISKCIYSAMDLFPIWIVAVRKHQ